MFSYTLTGTQKSLESDDSCPISNGKYWFSLFFIKQPVAESITTPVSSSSPGTRSLIQQQPAAANLECSSSSPSSSSSSSSDTFPWGLTLDLRGIPCVGLHQAWGFQNFLICWLEFPPMKIASAPLPCFLCSGQLSWLPLGLSPGFVVFLWR